METLDEMLKPEENQAPAEAYIQEEEKPNVIEENIVSMPEAEIASEPENPEAEVIKEPEALPPIEPPKPYSQDEDIKRKDNEQVRKRRMALIGVAVVILVIVAIGISLYGGTGEITGYSVATREVPETTTYDAVFEQSTEIPLELANITSLKITGTLEGTRAVVKLRINEMELLVADITIPNEEIITGLTIAEELPTYIISTEKPEYALGETVTITITPDAEDKSLYVAYGEDNTKLDEGTNTYLPAAAGEYQAIALIVVEEDILRISTNFTVIEASSEEPVEDEVTEEPTTGEESSEALTEPTEEEAVETAEEETIAEGEPAATIYEFTELCSDTCNLGATTNPTLIIEVEPGSKLTIKEVTITRMTKNSAPEQTQSIPDMNLAAGQAASLSLDEYFADPEGDAIQYDMNEIPEVSAAILQSELSISSEAPGVYTAYIYATDGDQLVTSNTFTITVDAGEFIAETNETTNETINETIGEIITDPCANPDINQRPSICFVGVEEQAFEELNIDLQDKSRGTIGRFTRFGNLIIKGLLMENSAGSPQENDFALGYTEREGFDETRVNSAWISTETGNLHLAGRIYENQEELSPAQFNTFVIRNKFGMILGYFDEVTGDLYLRGNIVQLGRIG